MHITVSDSDLPESAFVTLPAGGSINVNFDVAEVHDLSAGGDYAVRIAGSIPYTTDNGRTLTGAAKYDAGEILSMAVDGEQALQARLSNIAQRSEAVPCTSAETSSLSTAKTNCGAIAAAGPGGLTNARMDTWFHDHSTATVNTVKGVYNAAASGCSTTIQCSTSTYKACADGAIAYTRQGDGIYTCPVFFKAAASSSTACHGTQTQGNVLLHESTHLKAGTVDNAYGYDNCIALTTSKALKNADTYARLGQDIFGGCSA